jgi:hypothetical protein
VRRLRQPEAPERPLVCAKYRVAGRVQRRQGDPRLFCCCCCCCCAPVFSDRYERSKLVLAEEVVQQQQVDISLGNAQFAERCRGRVRASRLIQPPHSCVCALRWRVAPWRPAASRKRGGGERRWVAQQVAQLISQHYEICWSGDGNDWVLQVLSRSFFAATRPWSEYAAAFEL